MEFTTHSCVKTSQVLQAGCVQTRKVNNVTKTDSFPIPRIENCIDKIGNVNYIMKFDLLKGFWQIPLIERAKEISASVTSDGLST